MNKILIFSLVFSIASVSSAVLNPKIVNGVEVPNSDQIAKSTVMLTGKYQRFSFTCTGTIIAKDLVVTAAHCLGPYAAAKITAFFGVNKNQSGQTYNVIKQVQPDNYLPDQYIDRNDIALLLLEKPIPSGYQAANIITESMVLRPNDILILAGYGINVTTMPNNGTGGIGVLRAVEQNILEPQYGQTEILINIQNKGTCSGDSGGPAFLKKDNQLFLVGAASRMTDKDIVPGSKPVRYECTSEIVYTNVLKQLSWLKAAEAQLHK